MAENNQQPAENSKDGLALIIGGLFILALVFAAYKYFNNPSTGDIAEDDGAMTQDVDNDVGDLNGDGITDERDDDLADEKQTDESKTLGTGGSVEENIWVANDYNQGDIKSGSYTVQSGDTLWEIAEAVYGNGAEWTRVLEANKSSVGFLPNGQQSLIITGQTLMIP